MRVGVLTSSRADFGIYLPLLKKLKADDFFDLKIIAFGTHLSKNHGETVKQIEESGFNVEFKIDTIPASDTPEAIAVSMGKTTKKFAKFWNETANEFDIVFCLGDRYEMFSAVLAGIPFQIRFAHIHGGEKTLGAIDNIFRHSISLASKYHFVSTALYGEKVKELTESEGNIFYVGALSLDNINEVKLLSIEEFKEKWGIDLSKKTILVTFHPETVAIAKNKFYVNELIHVLNKLTDYHIVITMPNADTMGNILREEFNSNFQDSKRVHLIENFGTQSYFTALKYSSFLLGNTSSGIIEAASFGKYVINVGDRQAGRLTGSNVIHSLITREDIMDKVKKIEKLELLSTENLYYNGGAADKIINALKSIQNV